MRKKNQRNKWQTLPGMVALLCGLAGNVQAAPVAQKPVQVPVSPDAQARIALSNTQPNLLVVPGDRIVGVDSAQGTFTNTGEYGQTGIANGGVILMTEKTAPFTFYIRTEGGLVVSVIGQPQARDGRVVHLISERPVRHQAAAAWERSHDYVALLVDVQRTLMKGDIPPGYVFSPVVAAPVFSLPAGLVARADGMWSGNLLRVYRYRIQEVAVKRMWCGLLISLPLAAKDLGVQGDLWPVQEQSMLSLIHQRLESMEASGQLAEMQTQFKERVVQNTLRPKPVEGLQTDTRSHTHRVDPTVSVTADMADQNGRIFARKGQRINPLDTVSLAGPLYFLDADDERQVAWFKQQPAELNRKVILVGGNIRDATKALNTRIYFDQDGTLSRRFGLTWIPAVVRQDGSSLVVTSAAMPEGKS